MAKTKLKKRTDVKARTFGWVDHPTCHCGHPTVAVTPQEIFLAQNPGW